MNRSLPPATNRILFHTDTCPRCSGSCLQEAGASRCRLCGRVYYIAPLLADQRRYEEKSGLVRIGGFTIVNSGQERGRQTAKAVANGHW